MTEQGILFSGVECGHQNQHVLPMVAGPHHAKRMCLDCGKFLGWVPKPETLARQLRNKEILTALSKLELPAWERQFVRDVASHKNISPRQQAKLLQLEEIYLK